MQGFVRLVVGLYAYVLLLLPCLHAFCAIDVLGAPLGTAA